tara:strand:- start:1234 stop:1458 length:225 start_codon:yes stop_codon:yes gene_type:complete
MYKTIDLHGYKLKDAIDLVEREIGRIRMRGNEEDLHIITGRGIIRIELMNYLKIHHIDHDYELGNDGAIIIRVE